MKMRFHGWTASIVLASIVSNQVLFAYGPEASFWEERREEQRRRSLQTGTGQLARGPSPASLFGQGGVGSLPVIEKCPVRSYAGSASVPKGLGETCGQLFSAVPLANATIRKISLPPNKTPRGLIFHIQDVHRNLDAQTNISQVVTSLINVQSGSLTVALVGLEGAFRPYDLSWLRSFPDPKATRIAAEDLLAQDKMSGPIFSLLTSPSAIPTVVGIDDFAHYTANIDAYRRSLPSRETIRARVKDQQKALDEQKVRTFPPALRAFDQTVQAYHRGNESLGAYVRALDIKGGSPLAEPIALFLRALQMEETLDFKQVDRERTILIETLSQKMNQTQTNDLIAHSVSYRSGQLSYGDFYRWLTSLCQEVGVSLADYPAMGAYIRYVLLSESIDADALLRETDQRERDVFHQLAKTEDEKKIIEESHRLSLMTKLVDFALTPTEWTEYERTRSKTSIGFSLEPYETFYREAHARDTAMAENFIRSLATVQRPPEKGTPFSISIVVTGGYHGPGLTEKLTNAGMAVVTVVPKIQKIDTAQGSSYLTVFAQEKTPLDKLFEGAKLFVADSPLSPQNAALQAVGEAVGSAKPGTPLSKNGLAFLKSHFESVIVKWVGMTAIVRLKMRSEWFSVRCDTSQPVGKKIQAEELPMGSRFSIWIQALRRYPVDGRLLKIGPVLVIAGIWFFFTGTGLVQKMGPLLSMSGLMISLWEWTNRTGGPALAGHISQASQRPESGVGPLATLMQSISESSGRRGLEEEQSKPYTNLSSIPSSLLMGRLVVVRTTQDEAGSNTVRYLVSAGARVVLLSDGDIDPTFVRGLNTPPTLMTGELRREKNNGVSEQKWRWVSVKDKMVIENMAAGSVVIFNNASRDDRMNDSAKRGAMAMEVAGIEPNMLFVLDEQVPATNSPSAIDELGRLLPGVKGPSVKTEEISMPLWGWDPNRALTEGTIVGGDWKPLLHDPNNKEYVFAVDDEAGTFKAISRRQVADGTKDLFSQVMDFIKTQNRVNAGVGTVIDVNGKPRTEKFVKIEEEKNENEALVNFILYFKNGRRETYKGDVPDDVMRDPDLVLMIIQNTKRASRPGADVKKVSKFEAENNLEMYKLTPNFIKTQMPLEMFLEWMSKGKRLFFMTINPFPYFPNHIGRDPKNDVDHVMLSRGDKHVSQSELGSIEFLTDAFEAMETLNSSPEMGDKIPFHLGMNGWYYGKDFKAGASQNQAHAHLLRERFPVEHAPVTVIEETSGVKIGYLADPENGPGLVLEANRDNFSSLIQKTHEALNLITKKGDSFNILAFRVGDGYRVIIADKVVGVPTNDWFQNEFAFTESCGRAIIGDDPRKVFEFTATQSVEFEEIDPDNKTVIVKWVKDKVSQGELGVHPGLMEKARQDILSVSASREEIEELAKRLISDATSRNTPTGIPLYKRLDTHAEDESWRQAVQAGTRIDRGDGERWIGVPAHALTSFMKEVYFNGHLRLARLFRIPARLDFFGDIHVIHFSDFLNWRNKLSTMSLAELDAINLDRIQTSKDYLRRSEDFIPTVKNFQNWLTSFTGIISFIGIEYVSSRGTERLLEKARSDKRALEPEALYAEEMHHLKMQGLGMFRRNMEPFTNWLIQEEKIQKYEDIFDHSVKWVENELRAFENRESSPRLDSLLSRFFSQMERKAPSPAASEQWRRWRGVNDFIAAPLYETAVFFMLPAASGSLFFLGVGTVLFVGLHFIDDYFAQSPEKGFDSKAFQSAVRAAVSRLVRVVSLYAAPFAIYMVFPDVFQLLANVGVVIPSALSPENGLLHIAGMVALVHAGRNIVKSLITRSGLVDQALLDGDHMTAVLLGKKTTLPTDQLIEKNNLFSIFPDQASLQIGTLGSPGLRFINKVDIGLQNSTYSSKFGQAIHDGMRNYLSRERGQVPSTAQMLARLQVFVLGGASAVVDIQSGGVGEKIPVKLEIITAKDLPVLSKTLELMKAVNQDQKKPLHLLLAGVDTETVKALKELAKGFDHVSLMDNPVGVGIEKSEMWQLNPVVLNQGYREFQKQFQESFSLSVSLSDGISFSKEDLDHSGSSPVDQALKEALLHYLLSPLQPLHVASMLNLIRIAREAINQSA
jgi:hypothetical protein